MDSIKAPWTPKQVAALNRFQQSGVMHEFTCPNTHPAGRTLVATENGWICQHCDYRQDWAHAMMAMPWIGPPDWKCPECGSEEPERSPLHIGICSKCCVSDLLPKK